MPKWKIFALGALGGLLPILVSLATTDLAAFFDHTTTLTTGNMLGYGLRASVLIFLGGVVAALNSEVTQPMSLVQLGIAAPALITSAINSVPPANVTKVGSIIEIVQSANAAEMPEQRYRVAGGFFGDLIQGLVRAPNQIQNDQINRDVGQALGKAASGPASTKTPAGAAVDVALFPPTVVTGTSQSALLSGTYCVTSAGLYGPGPNAAPDSLCVVKADGSAILGTTKTLIETPQKK